MNSLKEILDFNQKFVEDSLKKREEIVPQIVVNHNGEITIFVLVGLERDDIRNILKMLEKTKPKWLVFITEGYMRIAEKDEDLGEYKHGELEKRFKEGDKNIKEIVSIQAYNRREKLMRIIDKKTLKPITRDISNFDGFLTVSDVERIFWSD